MKHFLNSNKEFVCRNPVYEFFDAGAQDFLDNVRYERTPVKGSRVSDNSYSFTCQRHADCNYSLRAKDCLEAVFDIKIPDELWMQATNGRGKELKRILTMHSSALLSFLYFFDVSEQNPIKLDIDGKTYTFTRVEFEHRNRLRLEEENPEGDGHMSSIDVALYDELESCVLYLEAKFSEFVHGGKRDGISRAYAPFYTVLTNMNIIPDELCVQNLQDKQKDLCISTRKGGRCYHYCEGIKQMISHFLGAANSEDRNKLRYHNVYLGTILFDFGSGDVEYGSKEKLKNAYEDYAGLYGKLASGLNELDKKKYPVTVIEESYSYQGFLEHTGYRLPSKVMEFYSFRQSTE